MAHRLRPLSLASLFALLIGGCAGAAFDDPLNDAPPPDSASVTGEPSDAATSVSDGALGDKRLATKVRGAPDFVVFEKAGDTVDAAAEVDATPDAYDTPDGAAPDAWTFDAGSVEAGPGPLLVVDKGAVPTTAGSVTSNDGLVDCGPRCQAEAASVGAAGVFRGLVAPTSGAFGSTPASAASRFDAAGPTWVRPDGVEIATSAAAMLTEGPRLAPLSVTATRRNQFFAVYTGAPSISAPGARNCLDWNASGQTTPIGYSAFTDDHFFATIEDAPCAGPGPYYRYYCMQE